jgi:hypothetical protein
MRRALDARDGGCRFPGCDNTRFVDAHHIHHWVHGGETKLDNLVLLCRRHHRAVHEEGFCVERDGDCIRFVRPNGCVVPESPAMEPLERDGWLSLRQAHAQLGLKVDARTTVPSWYGERMDYDWAVGVLQDRAARGRVRGRGGELASSISGEDRPGHLRGDVDRVRADVPRRLARGLRLPASGCRRAPC